MDKEQIVKSTQEQAVASWINYLNQIRLNKLQTALASEQENLSVAMSTIKETLTIISHDIVNNGSGRGGQTGMHGFIAEVAECGISNARSQIEGNIPVYEWINDNGPDDLKRGAVMIQQKFVNYGNHLSLQAIRNHLVKYPDYVSNGGVYQIPSDHYEKIQYLLSISKEEANKMPTSTGDFSLKQWKEVHAFFEQGDISLDKIEPSILRYREVQRGTYEQTFKLEKEHLKEINLERQRQAYRENSPSFGEGARTAVIAAVFEGGTTFCIDVAKKIKSGKRLADFDEADWKEIFSDTAIGTGKGTVRGASTYLLTNLAAKQYVATGLISLEKAYTAAPSAVANALVTASFGIAEQLHLYRNGKLTEQELIESSEMLCLDAAVSAVSSLAGQVLIPVPMLGAVIGNAVGTTLYQITKDICSDQEKKLIDEYLKSLTDLENNLNDEYSSFINALNENMKLFMSILDRAFAPNISEAFEGSISLAKGMGVPTEEILDTKEKITSYFTD